MEYFVVIGKIKVKTTKLERLKVVDVKFIETYVVD